MHTIPLSLAGILTLRSLAYFLGAGAKGILAAVVFRFALPLTWGISLMRATLTDGENLTMLFQSGELIGLSFHSLAYLTIGLAVFAIGFWRARVKGTLAHH